MKIRKTSLVIYNETPTFLLATNIKILKFLVKLFLCKCVWTRNKRTAMKMCVFSSSSYDRFT